VPKSSGCCKSSSLELSRVPPATEGAEGGGCAAVVWPPFSFCLRIWLTAEMLTVTGTYLVHQRPCPGPASQLRESTAGRRLGADVAAEESPKGGNARQENGPLGGLSAMLKEGTVEGTVAPHLHRTSPQDPHSHCPARPTHPPPSSASLPPCLRYTHPLFASLALRCKTRKPRNTAGLGQRGFVGTRGGRAGSAFPSLWLTLRSPQELSLCFLWQRCGSLQ